MELLSKSALKEDVTNFALYATPVALAFIVLGLQKKISNTSLGIVAMILAGLPELFQFGSNTVLTPSMGIGFGAVSSSITFVTMLLSAAMLGWAIHPDKLKWPVAALGGILSIVYLLPRALDAKSQGSLKFPIFEVLSDGAGIETAVAYFFAGLIILLTTYPLIAAFRSMTVLLTTDAPVGVQSRRIRIVTAGLVLLIFAPFLFVVKTPLVFLEGHPSFHYVFFLIPLLTFNLVFVFGARLVLRAVFETSTLASPASTAASAVPAGSNPAKADHEIRLQKLKDLHTKGLLTDEEYQKKKQEMISEL